MVHVSICSTYTKAQRANTTASLFLKANVPHFVHVKEQKEKKKGKKKLTFRNEIKSR